MNFFFYIVTSLSPFLVSILLAAWLIRMGDGRGEEGLAWAVYAAGVLCVGLVGSMIAAAWFFPK